MRLKQGLHHVVGVLRVAVDVHQAPVLFIGVAVVGDAAACRGHAPWVLLIGVACLPPTVGEGKQHSTRAGDRVREQGLQQVAGGVGLRPWVVALFVAQRRSRHVAVRPNFREIHGLVAALGKVQGGGVRHIPAVHVHAPNVDVGQLVDERLVWQLAVGRGHGVVGVLRLDGRGRLSKGLVPHVQRSAEPLGVEVVFVAQFPKQDGRMRLEPLHVVEVRSGLQVVNAALVVPQPNNDREASGADFIKHFLGGDGFVHAQRVDAHVFHQGQILGQRLKAALGFSHRHRVVTHAVHEVRAGVGDELPFLDPNASGFRGGSTGAAEQHGGQEGKHQRKVFHGQWAGFKTWRSSKSRSPE